MATDDEIIKAFKLVLHAGLDYPPKESEIPDRVDAWCELLPDIPGDTLIQAARDIVMKSEKFPSVPRMREAARQVMIHNNTSAVSNPFKPMEPVGKEPPGFFVVGADGWRHMDAPAQLPDAKQREYLAEYERMMAQEEAVQAEIAAYLAQEMEVMA